MNVVQINCDSEESVDDIAYELTPAARMFLADRAPSYFSPFADTLTTNFITPERLLDACHPETSGSIMQDHLDQNDVQVANNARHFMKHMNAQSYCCAKAFPVSLGIDSLTTPKVMLDIGGGSAIYSIEAVKSNPDFLKGIVLELPAIKPITEEYISNAGLEASISVQSGDFFSAEPFPSNVDYVLFSNILHDWSDATNMKLIKKAFDCLSPGGKIVISELLLADDVKSSSSAATSMNIVMIPHTKGRQYTKRVIWQIEECWICGTYSDKAS